MSTTIDAPDGGPGRRSPRRFTRIAILGGLAAVILAAAAALLLLPEKHPAIHVSGRVTGPDGAPLAGVRIALEITPAEDEEASPAATVSTHTDAAGRFTIDVQPASPDSWYRLTAQKAGYAPAELDPVDPDAGPVIIPMSAVAAPK